MQDADFVDRQVIAWSTFLLYAPINFLHSYSLHYIIKFNHGKYYDTGVLLSTTARAKTRASLMIPKEPPRRPTTFESYYDEIFGGGPTGGVVVP